MNDQSYQKKLSYNKSYNKASYKAYTFRLNRIADADLIDTLDSLDTVTFIRNALRQYRLQHNLTQNLRSRKTKKLGMPYEVYAKAEDGSLSLIGTADDLDQAKALRDASGAADCVIVKRYMNRYSTIVGMKVKA